MNSINRRDFLRLGGLSLVGLFALPAVNTVESLRKKFGDNVERPVGMKMDCYFEMTPIEKFSPDFFALEMVGCQHFSAPTAEKCLDATTPSSFRRTYDFVGMADKVTMTIEAGAEQDRTTLRLVTPFFDKNSLCLPNHVLIATVNGEQTKFGGTYHESQRFAVAQDGKGGLFYRFWRKS